MQQTDLKMSADNLRDATNTIKVTEAQSNAVTTPTHENFWQGGYTENFYYENDLGAPHNAGFGDGPAETGAEKPGPDKKLYLLYPPQYDSPARELVLHNTEAEYFGGYNYVAWGTWSDPDAGYTKVYTSHWVVVDQINRDQKPTSGTATYTGELRGTLWTQGQDNSYHNANGDISMTADFGANTIYGHMNVRNADHNTEFASGNFNTKMITTPDGDSLRFNGQMSGPGVLTGESSIRGALGGNQAAEAGGTWAITKTSSAQIEPNGQATGVFRAHK